MQRLCNDPRPLKVSLTMERMNIAPFLADYKLIETISSEEGLPEPNPREWWIEDKFGYFEESDGELVHQSHRHIWSLMMGSAIPFQDEAATAWSSTKKKLDQ